MSPKKPSASKPKDSIRPRRSGARQPAPPIVQLADLRTILFELANQLAPADIEALLAHTDQLRAEAARIRFDGHAGTLRAQIDLALECLHDHCSGACPQIPYYTISLLGAGLSYFANELDVIPDFLPGVGRLDDAAVMALACQFAEAGLRRYCAFKGYAVDAIPRLLAK